MTSSRHRDSGFKISRCNVLDFVPACTHLKFRYLPNCQSLLQRMSAPQQARASFLLSITRSDQPFPQRVGSAIFEFVRDRPSGSKLKSLLFRRIALGKQPGGTQKGKPVQACPCRNGWQGTRAYPCSTKDVQDKAEHGFDLKRVILRPLQSGGPCLASRRGALKTFSSTSSPSVQGETSHSRILQRARPSHSVRRR